jgi:hypothetical protein
MRLPSSEVIMRVLVLTVCCLIVCVIPAAAQRNDSVCAQIQQSIANKAAPTWKLTKQSTYPCDRMSFLFWKSGKSTVVVWVYPKQTATEASDIFRLLEADDVMTEEKISTLGTGLRELGDENRLWMTPNFRGRGVDFRKGNVVVRVSADNLELALQFATFISIGLTAA